MDVHEMGNRFARRRKELQLRQEDLAEMSGITTRTIYNIEEGTGNPSYKTLCRLCEVLGLEIIVNVKIIN